jgi:hypothetical protein
MSNHITDKKVANYIFNGKHAVSLLFTIFIGEFSVLRI